MEQDDFIKEIKKLGFIVIDIDDCITIQGYNIVLILTHYTVIDYHYDDVYNFISHIELLK